jgi:hypothetical protein
MYSYFNIGTLRGAHLGFRSHGCRRSRGRILLAAVNVVDVNVLRRVQLNAGQRPASGIDFDGSRFQHLLYWQGYLGLMTP